MDTQLAERLQKLRKENNFSQEQLADELNVSRQAISKWECGAALPDTENLIALAKLYNCSIDDIVFDRSAPVGTGKAATENSTSTPTPTDNDEGDEDNEDEADNNDNRRGKGYDYVAGGKIVNVFTSVTVLLSVTIYVLCGALLNKWHPAWIVFLSIPLVATLAESIVRRNKHLFAFPIFVVAVYLMLGCIGGLWHPWWVIFILIPVYYLILGLDFSNPKSNRKK